MNNKVKKSTIAPIALKITDSHLIVGDKYVKNLLVTKFPQEFGLGLLSYYISNPRIKVFIKEKKYTGNFDKYMNKEYKEVYRQWQSTTDPTLRERLEQKLQGYQGIIEDIVHSNDQVLDVVMVFRVTANTLEELNSEVFDLKALLQMEGVIVSEVHLMQEEIFKFSAPMFIKSGLNQTLTDNYGIPLTATNFAGMWPYNFQTLEDPNGFLFGREKNNHGIIKWDPFFFVNNELNAIATARTAGNILLFGKTGMGKTTAMGLIVRYLIRIGAKVIWTDPENKNYYMTKKYGGTFVALGSKGGQINPFDLQPVTVDEDQDADMWDTEVSIYNAIKMFKKILRLYQPNLSSDVFNVIDELMIEMYKRKDIIFNKSFRGLDKKDYPILSDLKKVLDDKAQELGTSSSDVVEKGLLESLDNALKPMLSSDKFYFDGHTTIDTNKNLISFGTKGLQDVDQELRDTLNYMMSKFTWATAVEHDGLSATIYDEAQEFILEGETAKEISRSVRRSRKHDNITVIGSQEPRDFNSEVMVGGVPMKTHGTAIMNNSTYKIILGLEKEARDELKNMMQLNETEIDAIGSFVRGDALFVVGNRRIPIQVLVTETERREMDPNSVRGT